MSQAHSARGRYGLRREHRGCHGVYDLQQPLTGRAGRRSGPPLGHLLRERWIGKSYWRFHAWPDHSDQDNPLRGFDEDLFATLAAALAAFSPAPNNIRLYRGTGA